MQSLKGQNNLEDPGTDKKNNKMDLMKIGWEGVD
jgi:hypothetical protein